MISSICLGETLQIISPELTGCAFLLDLDARSQHAPQVTITQSALTEQQKNKQKHCMISNSHLVVGRKKMYCPLLFIRLFFLICIFVPISFASKAEVKLFAQ